MLHNAAAAVITCRLAGCYSGDGACGQTVSFSVLRLIELALETSSGSEDKTLLLRSTQCARFLPSAPGRSVSKGMRGQWSRGQ